LAKKRKSASSKKSTKKVNRNLIVGCIVIVLVVLLYYLFAMQNGDSYTVEPEEGGYISGQQSMAENLPKVVGQSYFGYMKEGYVLNVEVGGKVRRIEIVSLNDDGTVDIVMARAFNLEEGETVLADYDYDDVADLGFTLEGVDLYENRFSATVTYFATAPDEIVREE
jgi:hypothetical protein